MGRTNLRYKLEKEISHLLGELHVSDRYYEELRAALRRIIPLRQKIRELKRLAEAPETLLFHNHFRMGRKPYQAVKSERLGAALQIG